MNNEPLDSSLLPDYNRLRAEAGWDFTLRNYIESCGSVELAVAFAKLFWPDFVEHHECVIRSDGFSADNFAVWSKRLSGDCAAIERVLNQLHVSELVPSDTTELDVSVIRYLAETITAMWTARVKSLFPERRFVVRLEHADDDSASGPTVILYQEH